MKKSLGSLILLVISLLTMLSGLFGFGYLNNAFSSQQEKLTFTDPAGDELVGTYLPGKSNIGVIFLEGFGSDQIAMKPAANLFLKAGAHIFTFDFSGHGRSPGTLGFDNAATDRLAQQVMAAKETFKSLSGLSEDQIIYFGHSLGARVALQAAVLDASPPAALVLLGTQVNLGTNVQAEFFTGTSDSELAWVQMLGPDMPQTHILLLSGSWDDILTPDAALALHGKLTGIDYAAPGAPPTALNTGNPDAARTLTIIPKILHNYEIYSTKILTEAFLQLEDLGLLTPNPNPSLRSALCFGALTLGGLLASLILLPIWMGKRLPRPASPPLSTNILRLGRFLWGKLLLWLGALPLAALLSGLFFLIPLGLPVFNMLYVGFIGGYGLLMLALYLLGKIPGARGKWRLRQNALDAQQIPQNPLLFWGGLLAWAAILLALVVLTRSGLYYVIAPNQRLIWLAIFTPVTALGFWIGARESQMLETFSHEAGRKVGWAKFLLSLINLMPFFLFTAFMGALGSLSGMVGSLQGLLVLAIILLTGRALAFFVRRHWLIAILQAILLYALILPQGVLFAF